MTKPKTEEIIEEPEVTTEEQVEEQVEEITPPISEGLQKVIEQTLNRVVKDFEDLDMNASISDFASDAKANLAIIAEGYYRWLEHEFEEFKASVRRAKRAQNRITKELQSDMWSKEHKMNLEEEHARNVEILAATPAAFSDMKVILRALKTLRPS